jgi:hypothetical protein
MKKVDWLFRKSGTANISPLDQRQLAAVMIEVAIEAGLLSEVKEVREHDQKTKVLQMRRGLDPEKLCSGI